MRVILALYPNSRGLGYACLELPQNLFDCGVVSIRPLDNQRVLARTAKYMDYYRPDIVVVRDATASAFRGKRIMRIANEITEQAVERNVPVYQYTREQVKEVFGKFGGTTKYDIAERIGKWITELAQYVPDPRKPYENEDYYMGIFDALALAITHDYYT